MVEVIISLTGFLLIQLILFSITGFWSIGQKVTKLANDISHVQKSIVEMKGEMQNVYSRINDIDQRLSRLEGKTST